MFGFYPGMDLSEVYNRLIDVFTTLSIILFAYLILVLTKIDIWITKKFLNFREKRKKLAILIVIFLLAASIFLSLFYLTKSITMDIETTVKIDEKIVIIEIDDYWNLEDTEDYFAPYGYDMETFRAVSNILDKHNAVASLGVTPHIFIEEIRENAALEDDPIMIEYLKELNSKGYELAMHGYNHCRNENYCPKYEEVWYNIFKGKSDLEELFKISFTTYFPPGNTWTDEQYDNVKKAGFKVIGNTHVPKAYFDEEVIITNKGYDPIYHYAWYRRDFRHTEVEEWIEEYNKADLFLLQLHCNTFDTQKKLDDLDTFLNHITKDNAKIMTYREFYNHIQDKKN